MKGSRGMSTKRFLMSMPMLLLAVPAYSNCVPCPCDLCDLSSSGQANLVIMDRDHSRITLIPNIPITGTGEDFALLLPMPSIPEVAAVSNSIWDQAFALTAPQSSIPRQGLGCSQSFENALAPNAPSDDGVNVLGQTHVGAFLLTTLEATDPNVLVTWLNQNGFTLVPEDAEQFRPYIERGWVFCAMRLDADAVQLGPSWDLSVDPVAFTFEGNQFEVPLGVLGINRGPSFKMLFFIVDQHRDTLPEFQTSHANRITPIEFAAIRTMYPQLAAFLSPGAFVTRLDRTIPADAPMRDSIFITRAEDDREYRRPSPGWMMSGDLVLGSILLLLLGAGKRIRAPFSANRN